MKVSCPNCGRIHDVTGLAPHSHVTCVCGQVFRVPAMIQTARPTPSVDRPGLKTPSEAVWSLVLGIVGLPVSPICLGPLASIPGLILGYNARAKIDADPETFGGRGLANGAIVLNWVANVIWGLLLLAGLLFLAVGAVASQP
ncbi:MAG: DUF4190 domain-containing protein [Deltaproteobacteria bacterium]|nr:DUF4190 domain-containing protein [bacterium]MCB9489899.1 DUF4190 domain-containing protein [Deltaproteobacteria bacterium]